MHNHPLCEAIDLDFDVSIVHESPRHSCYVFCIESHFISLSDYDLLPTALPHAHIDACDDLPTVPTPFLLFTFSSAFLLVIKKSIFLVYLLFFLLSLFHSPTFAGMGSELHKLSWSLTRHLVRTIKLKTLKKRL